MFPTVYEYAPTQLLLLSRLQVTYTF